MNRLLLAMLVLAMLPACADMPAQRLLSSWLSNPGTEQAAYGGSTRYRFDWQLSGDPSVGPLQVFDDGRRTWLQFGAQQTVPAIFSRNAAGDTLLAYRSQGPYVVLSGVWPLLILRGGKLESRVERISSVDTKDSAVSNPDLMENEAMAPRSVPPMDKHGDSASTTHSFLPAAEPLQDNTVLAASTAPAPRSEALGIELTAASFAIDSAQKIEPSFTISPNDQNLRLALMRWARDAGWRFDAEHWDVGVDIPIVGTASFQGAFVQAVQDLTAATELGDRPVQPCFYSNNVLRIVPYAQVCDRTAAHGNTDRSLTTDRMPS